MNFSKKIHELVDQNEQIVKKPQKHDANLQKNSTLYFQVGLILTLIVTYGLFEMQFQTTQIIVDDMEFDPEFPVYVSYVPEVIPDPIVEKKVAPVRKKLLAINFKPIDNDVELTKVPVDIITEPVASPNLDPGDIEVYKPKEPVDDIFSIVGVEQVPIYPGCEDFTTNNERRKCMSQKIGKLIRRKFNSDIAADLGLSGKQRINVQFKIDKMGNVTEIEARAPHGKLEREAVKVINKIPQMVPGKQRDVNVAVIYSLPIVLQVQ